MIFFDVETTGLIDNELLPLDRQPRIIEIGALKTDAEGVELGSLSMLIDPGMALPEIITKITGITDADLKGQRKFADVLPEVAAFFRGEETMLAHNARFDLMLLVFELRRLDKQWQFPFCSRVTDTRVRWRGKLAEWAKKVKGPDWVQSHRAIEDCRLLRDCWFATDPERGFLIFGD